MTGMESVIVKPALRFRWTTAGMSEWRGQGLIVDCVEDFVTYITVLRTSWTRREISDLISHSTVVKPSAFSLGFSWSEIAIQKMASQKKHFK